MRRPFKTEQDEIVDDGGWLETEPIECLEPRYKHGDESAAGDFRPVTLGNAFGGALEVISRRFEIGGNCESPIEEMLGAEILVAASRAGLELKLCRMMDLAAQDDGLLLVPQFRWGIYRSDWAILKNRKDAPALLIECDGMEYHSTTQQLAHDRLKDTKALERGHLTLRFPGTRIFREAADCARQVLEALEVLK